MFLSALENKTLQTEKQTSTADMGCDSTVAKLRLWECEWRGGGSGGHAPLCGELTSLARVCFREREGPQGFRPQGGTMVCIATVVTYSDTQSTWARGGQLRTGQVPELCIRVPVSLEL